MYRRYLLNADLDLCLQPQLLRHTRGDWIADKTTRASGGT
jgi:hypothetical protein